MSIQNVIINCTDIARSVSFYTRFLEAQVLGTPTEERASLDLVTAVIELRRVDPGGSSWIPDDLQLGFRHVGFKVDQVDPRAQTLKAAGVPFHLEPLDAKGAVRICFFYDPDGTLLEFVAGDLQYTEVHDPDGVRAERALGVPDRPRFDHVGTTVRDRAETAAFYTPLGYTLAGTLEQPQDPRGFSIGYLRGGDSVLEIFSFDDAKIERDPQPAAPGFARVELDGTAPEGTRSLTTDAGEQIYLDPNGLPWSLTADGTPA